MTGQKHTDKELQYNVTLKAGTKPPFDNKYRNNHREELCVEIISGKPLFDRKATVAASKQVATFAGGCFWGMQDLLRKQPGVTATEVGYTGGKVPNATYQNHEGHAEAVWIEFDPMETSYESLLRFFFRIHDPTTQNRQGNDTGTSYRSAIFYHDEEQQRIALKVKTEVDAGGKWNHPIVTEIAPAGSWWRAEEYHQDYLVKNPGGYSCHWVREQG